MIGDTVSGSFESLIDKKNRWPKQGDRIAQDISKPTDAYISAEPYERALFLWRGYFRAGDLLAKQCERDPFDVNYLIYPMMFNFRHALEVAMKELISEYGSLVKVYLAPSKDHNLLELWKSFRKMTEELGGDGDGEATKAVGLVIQDFHDLDSGSVAFRYSTNKDGATFKFASGVVTVAKLKDVMVACQHYFEGSDDYYHDLKSNVPTEY